MKPTRLSFSPALPCVDCRVLTTQGLIHPMSSQVWQLLPLCSKDITNRIQAIEQLQSRRRRIARAYVRLRRQHAHVKAQRALRWRLCRMCQREKEAMEVQR
jgi:hypothetical protein